MATATINFTGTWKRQPTDCRNCSVCEDIIVTDMWRLCIQHNGGSRKITQCKMVICNSCRQAMKDEIFN